MIRQCIRKEGFMHEDAAYLNALLDKEDDELVNAEKYERSSDRQGYRSGYYKRKLHTTAGRLN